MKLSDVKRSLELVNHLKELQKHLTWFKRHQVDIKRHAGEEVFWNLPPEVLYYIPKEKAFELAIENIEEIIKNTQNRLDEMGVEIDTLDEQSNCGVSAVVSQQILSNQNLKTET